MKGTGTARRQVSTPGVAHRGRHLALELACHLARDLAQALPRRIGFTLTLSLLSVMTPVGATPTPTTPARTAAARTSAPVHPLTPAMAQCFEWASARFGMSSHLLYAIALQESGLNPRAVNRNTNGSQDIGLMQINSSWAPTLMRYGIRTADLWDPCTNIFVGAWILGGNLVRMGPTVAALGAYNARDPVKREAYARRVLERLHRLSTATSDAPSRAQAPTPLQSPVSASRQSGELRTFSPAMASPATGPHLASP